MKEEIILFFENLLKEQIPSGEDFDRILNDNLFELYGS